MAFVYLCLNANDIIIDIMVTDYSMIHPERIEWDVADYTQIGNKYNKITGLVEIVTKQPQTVFSKLEFRQRFNLDELTTIYGVEDIDPVIKIFMDDLRVADHIDTTHIMTQNAMGYLYNKGHITYERMLEILG